MPPPSHLILISFIRTSTKLDIFICYWHNFKPSHFIIGIFFVQQVQVLVEVICTYVFRILLKTRLRRRSPCVPSVNTNCSTISSTILSICYQAPFHPGAEQETGDEYSVLIWNRVRPKCRSKQLTFLFPVSLERYKGERRDLWLFLRALAFKHNTLGSHLVLCILLHNSAQYSPFIPRKQHSFDLKHVKVLIFHWREGL